MVTEWFVTLTGKSRTGNFRACSFLHLHLSSSPCQLMLSAVAKEGEVCSPSWAPVLCSGLGSTVPLPALLALQVSQETVSGRLQGNAAAAALFPAPPFPNIATPPGRSAGGGAAAPVVLWRVEELGVHGRQAAPLRGWSWGGLSLLLWDVLPMPAGRTHGCLCHSIADTRGSTHRLARARLEAPRAEHTGV